MIPLQKPLREASGGGNHLLWAKKSSKSRQKPVKSAPFVAQSGDYNQAEDQKLAFCSRIIIIRFKASSIYRLFKKAKIELNIQLKMPFIKNK